MPQNVGILGGAFNPPHNAHLLLAEAAMKAYELEEVLFIPTHIPPHKEIEEGWDSETRVLLTEIATCFIHPEVLMRRLMMPHNRQEEWNEFLELYTDAYEELHKDSFRVSEIEINREETSYTIDTVKALLAENPDWVIHIIIGMDQAAVLDTWKDWEELSNIARFCVADRGGLEWESVMERYPFLTYFDFPRLDISSTLVRQRIKKGEPIGDIVPPYIEKILPLLINSDEPLIESTEAGL